MIWLSLVVQTDSGLYLSGELHYDPIISAFEHSDYFHHSHPPYPRLSSQTAELLTHHLLFLQCRKPSTPLPDSVRVEKSLSQHPLVRFVRKLLEHAFCYQESRRRMRTLSCLGFTHEDYCCSNCGTRYCSHLLKCLLLLVFRSSKVYKEPCAHYYFADYGHLDTLSGLLRNSSSWVGVVGKKRSVSAT